MATNEVASIRRLQPSVQQPSGACSDVGVNLGSNSPQPIATPPSAAELATLLPRVFGGTRRVDRSAALTLYLFLPVKVGRMHFRSSLEALLRDARGAAGRDPLTGVTVHPDQSRSWLAAIGYLSLVDQVSKLLEIPVGDTDRRTAFERLLVWHGDVLDDEAAALYALRCAFVHSYGLLNDPRDMADLKAMKRNTPAQRKKYKARVARDKSLLHMFELQAEGHDLVRLGNRRIRVDTQLSRIAPTSIDLLSLANTIESLIATVRSEHVGGARLEMRSSISSDTFVRACFFMHGDPVQPSQRQPGAPSSQYPRGRPADPFSVSVDSSSPSASALPPG